MQEEEFHKMWVDSLINCCKPNCEVTASTLESSYVVLSCLYQFEDLVLKSPRTTVRNGFWLLILSNESCKLSANSSKESEIDLVIDLKKWNYIISHRSKFQKLSILVDNEHQLVSKQVNFYNIHKDRPSYY